MIRVVEISNFQSHTKTRLDLGMFTAIVGPSSSGKTGVMRALLWLFHGDWDATYPNDPSKPTAVAVELDDGTRIVRMRHGDDNRAAIQKPGSPPLKFRDFGYVIPGIFDIMNMRPIQSGDRKVNLQFSTQDEPLFMLSESYSKPARAQWIGRLYGAHVVNSMLRLLARDKKDAEASIKALETERRGLQEHLKAFEGLGATETLLARSEAILRSFKAISAVKASISGLNAQRDELSRHQWALSLDTDSIKKSLKKLDKIKKLSQEFARVAADSVAVLAPLSAIPVDLSSFRMAITRLGSLRKLSAAVRGYRESGIRLLSECKRWATIGLENTKAGLRRLSVLRVARDGLAATAVELERVQDEIARSSKRAIEIKDAMFADGRCPLCGAIGLTKHGGCR